MKLKWINYLKYDKVKQVSRISNNLKFETLFFIEKTLYWSFLEEQKILKEHSKNRITLKRNGFYSTEVFDIDIFNGNYNYENN